MSAGVRPPAVRPGGRPPATASKGDRQRALLELVRERPFGTQRGLAGALAERGFAATQATVSRDIRELGLVRSGAGYRAPPGVAAAAELVLSVRRVEFLVVVRTPPGTAGLVARAIDEAAPDGVAGTVAGDDTIIAVLTSAAAGGPLRRFLGADG